MASAYKKGPTWYISIKQTASTGEWKGIATTAKTKREALQLAIREQAAEDERAARLGTLGKRGPVDVPATFGQLFEWWWGEYGSTRARPEKVEGFLRRHLAPLFPLSLAEIDTDAIEGRLNQARTRSGDRLSPKSTNNLRVDLLALFEVAIRRNRWFGPNPVSAVPRQVVPKRIYETLSAEEVPVLLRAVPMGRRPLFAMALYTGLRQGELLGMRWADIDFHERTITVRRSYDADTTKGKREATIPIAAELMPYLEEARRRAGHSPWVFPDRNGRMQPETTRLRSILRRALGKAGIVTGYEHRCRRKGCKYRKTYADSELRKCPKCQMKLWPVPIPRHVRFHDLRHTTATLLLKAGVSLAVVQQIMRHQDPRTTMEIYGHLDLTDMRKGMEALAFSPPASDASNARTEAERASQSHQKRVAGGENFLPGVLPGPSALEKEKRRLLSPRKPPLSMVGETGFEPATPWSRTRKPVSAAVTSSHKSPHSAGISGRQVPGQAAADDYGHPSRPTRVLPEPPKPVPSLSLELPYLTVREVADRAGVTVQAIYHAISVGQLRAVRDGRSVRVRAEDAAEYLRQRVGGRR